MRVATALVTSGRWLAQGLGALVLPDVCAACAAAPPAAEGLCETCNRELLTLAALPACPRCGATLGPNIPARDDGCDACGATLPRFQRVVRIGPYAGPLRSAVRNFKYHRRERLRRRLARLLAEAVATRAGSAFDLVAPVPMHWRRRLARGYDHAGILAGQIARTLRRPLDEVLVRVRHTAPQVRLSRTQRVANVRGAFAVRRRADLDGARVLLVDDVTTTGATADEAARTLRRGGASSVTLAVVAKAESPTAYADHIA
ncbi:MAG: ComF family protein [Phycisphaerae bacterium]|nr:ComF family protein [Phycisphaerae bacterium]